MSDYSWQSLATNSTILTTLAGLGTFYAFKQLSSITLFAYTHFLRPSSLSRYNRASDGESPASWALVTGSSDGIGKGFAEELCNRGFNVIIHGRNETKLKAVREELLKQWPKREVRVLVLDAGSEAGNVDKLDAAAEELKDLDLRVLVNNVGGGAGTRPVYIALHQTDAARTELFVNLNLRFPTEITRVLIPQLIKNSPALILNIGSIGSETNTPYISVYCGAKAYNKSWSGSLGTELKAEGHDIEVKLIQTGIVSSGAEPRDSSFAIPSARMYARSSLNKVGNANRLVYGYWPHELQLKVLRSLPTSIADKMLMDMIVKEKENEQKMLKGQ